MSDQEAPTGTPDHAAGTPAPAGSDGANLDQTALSTPETPTVDYEKRFNDLYPELTKAQQEAAEYRRLVESLRSDDPDVANEAAQALGIQFVDDTPETEDHTPEDPTQALQARIDQLETKLTERETREQTEQRMAVIEQHVETDLSALAQEVGGLSDTLKDTIVQLAVAMPPGENGMPNIRAAWTSLNGLFDEQKQAWAKSKRAPHFSSTGQQGTEQPDLSDDATRQRWMLERARAAAADT